VWIWILSAFAVALGVYAYLALTRFFTERAFMLAYRRAMLRSASHPDALRAALRVFERRPPFNLLTEAEIDHACMALAALHEPRIVARIVRLLDRTRDASLLRSETFLRGVVFTHSWMPH
jgi:hypothetical protein